MREPEYFEPMWKECLDIGEKYDFAVPQLPRYRRAPRRIDDGQPPHSFPDVKSHFLQKFIDAVDSVMGLMERRLEQPALRLYMIHWRRSCSTRLMELVVKTVL